MSTLFPKSIFKGWRHRYVGAPFVMGMVVQKPYVQQVEMKPWGLWYSGGDDWWRWMAQNTPRWWPDYREVHEIEVDESRILVMRGESDVIRFNNRYRAMGRSSLIDWRAVEKDWAGVEINPYQDGLRMADNFLWYYPWDAASGCIWDVSAITDIRHVGTLPPLPPRE